MCVFVCVCTVHVNREAVECVQCMFTCCRESPVSTCLCVFEQFPFVHMPVTAVMLKVVSINHCSSERKG